MKKYCILLVPFVVIFSGCTLFRAQPDYSRYYVLGNAEGVPKSMQGGGAKPMMSVGVARINLPEYLDEQRMIVGRRGAEIVYSDQSYWSEAFDVSFTRAFNQKLGGYAGGVRLFPSPWHFPLEHERTLYLTVVELLPSRDMRSMDLKAEYYVTDVGEECLVASGASHYTVPFRSSQPSAMEITAAVNELVDMLAKKISRDLTKSL